ncbi:DUF6624 domain-containing protein [Maribacter sp. IgM3_T14_3]|uniref:DUF6624 domain-containing protein n=1 Tax=Maribacter sp. IgM3_T14_3 TaxID=3415140 RepID=UPI003C6FE7A6
MKKSYLIIISFILFNCKPNSISESKKKEIISELNSIKEIDQKYAGLPPKELIENYGNKKAWEIFEIRKDSVRLLNQGKIKKLYEEYGYLGYNKIGKEASHDFWISIQHADNDIQFQRKMLGELKKEMLKNNASKSQYALLEDRVNVNSGEKQRFGTQVTYNSYGQAIPKNGLIDSLNVEKLRKEFNLPTFREYYNEMTTNHFEMNMTNMLKRGVMEPKLYE